MNKVNIGLTTLGYKYFFQSRQWTTQSLDIEIKNISMNLKNKSDRINFWIEKLFFTPFKYESEYLIPNDCIFINLDTFDCITFAYTIISLSSANSFDEFASTLYKLRYIDGSIIDNSKNFIDYACESILKNSIKNKILIDITEQIIPPQFIEKITMNLSPIKRPSEHDKEEKLIEPKYNNFTIKESIINSEYIKNIDIEKINDGDFVIFTHGNTNLKTKQIQNFFICHCGFIKKYENSLSLIHATKNYYLTADKEIFFPGVYYICEYLGDDLKITLNNICFYGYDSTIKRTLYEYSKSNFRGIKVFRIIS